MKCSTNKSKVVIAIVGDEMQGKTTSICCLAKLIQLAGKKQLYPTKKRFYHEVTLYGTYSKLYDGSKSRVGITTFGDNISLLKTHFVPLILNYQCDIVVVACHNDSAQPGSTLDFVRSQASANAYKLIVTSVIRDDSSPLVPARTRRQQGAGNVCINGIEINQVFASNMINLINSLV